MAGEVGLPKNAVANDLGLLKENKEMDNKKLKQLVKEALSNMVEEETENEVEVTVNINGEEQELDEIDVNDLADEDFGEAMSANELYKGYKDHKDDADLSDDHYQNVEEMNMGGGDPDADDLADQIIMMADVGLEEDAHSLREFFDLDEMARKAQSYKLTDRLTNAGSFLQRVNDRIKAKTMGSGGRGRKAKEFTDEDITNMLDVLGQGTFTSQDIVSAIGRFDKVQPVNAILAKMREKGYIDYDEDLKKSMEPDTSAEPKRRGRPAAPKPEDEFDAPEMEPEMAPDSDPVVQQATQAQAQKQDPKKQAVKSFMDQMKAMGVISDTNKVLDMDTYKDEFAKFKSTMNETLNESKESKKGLLTERFQQLAGIKPIFAINNLKEETNNLDELNLGQKALGVINRAKSFVKGLSPSADGAEIKQGLKDLGYSTTGMTMYSASSLPNSDISPEYRLGTANLSDEDLRKKVKVNQNQIDEGSMNTVFQAAVVAFDLNQNIPKLIAKVYYLNFSTGKYDFIQTKEEDLSPEDLRQHSDIDANRIKEETQPLMSISIGDLRKRVRAIN
tara:strand:- start:156 stop:1838 length:1683 start_codon:yes stop_codon:yes gene_type:complete